MPTYRSKRINFMMTPTELRELRHAATAAGMSLADWIRYSLRASSGHTQPHAAKAAARSAR